MTAVETETESTAAALERMVAAQQEMAAGVAELQQALAGGVAPAELPEAERVEAIAFLRSQAYRWTRTRAIPGEDRAALEAWLLRALRAGCLVRLSASHDTWKVDRNARPDGAWPA